MKSRWLFLAIPIAGIAELGLALYFDHAAPDQAEYEALLPAMVSLYREGDLVVVSPRWAEPHVRQVLGDEFFPLKALARSDDASFERAIEISVRGKRAEELKGFREVQRKDVGPLVLRVLENPKPERVVFDFVDSLSPEWASAGASDPASKCTWTTRAEVMTGGLGGHPGFPAKRFECPEGAFLNVSVTVIADEKFLPRRCIWAHPTATGERWVRFSAVTLGERIVGHSGMYWMMEREGKGAPVELKVRVDGDEIGTITHRDGDGWAAFELPLGDHARAASATVEFAVSSVDYRHRHFCFQADTR